MQSKASKVQQYINECPADQKPYIEKLRQAIIDNLPEGFQECMNYGMIGYVIPHSIYPSGYHCDPKLPLPFIALAAQKGSINFYHMGIYADTELLTRFQSEYQKLITRKMDMGKSCIRFRHYNEIPYNLIGELVSKITAEKWIEMYEKRLKS